MVYHSILSVVMVSRIDLDFKSLTVGVQAIFLEGRVMNTFAAYLKMERGPWQMVR